MRFIENGPSIPDELLTARDQGRVVFFCGAGVSRAKADLVDFFGLVNKVTSQLGVQSDSDVMKLLQVSDQTKASTGIEGIVSADRLFGLLEREFSSREIYREVANALVPKSDVDLSAHRTMLRLARTRENAIRLVTTNFDRLFELANVNLPTFIPPKLPDLSHPDEFHGAVYLHGRINDEGSDADGGSFVLSSSEFGEAYLSRGWATSFVKEILKKYIVVFVGYSADDPPVQYLLEALSKDSDHFNDIYAFQIGNASEANVKWQHKGVKAIAFDQYDALWNTLEAWAERADDPDEWVRKVLEKAQSRPELLKPHERGQIAYLVSTAEGARAFAKADNLPPAAWLNVFDSKLRYEKPKHSYFEEPQEIVDPFDLYALDSDFAPQQIRSEDIYADREIPEDAWDAFDLNSSDIISVNEQRMLWFRKNNELSTLPNRLEQIALWISRVADQPEAIWWSLKQPYLHPWVKQLILSKINHYPNSAVCDAWGYLFDSFDNKKDFNVFRFLRKVTARGWSHQLLREFAAEIKPYLTVSEPFSRNKNTDLENIRISDFISLRVQYPSLSREITVPDEWLARVVVVLRRNIEFAVELSEIGRFGWRDDFSIHSGNNAFRGQNRLSTWVQFLIVQFEKLCLFDPVAAQAEFSKWPHDDVEVFAKLRMWAIGKTGLIPNKQFTYVFESIPEEALWNPRHSSDLLPALKARWDDLNIENQLMVERKFIEGPPRWEDESDEAYQNRRTRRVLNRLIWLQQQGCTLQTDTSELEQLRSHIPEWQPEHAQDEMKANSSGVYRVRTKDDYSVLNGVPLNQILIRANEESGRSEDRRTQFDPFLGLSKECPVRAFSALRCAVKQGEIPEWAWRTFLQPHIRKEDKPRLTVLIAAQILRLPCEQAAKIIVPICYWINETCSVIAEHDQALFYQLISKSIKTLSHPVIQVHFSIVRGDREPDWLFESINSSVGQLTLSFFEEPQINWIKSDNESSSWLVLLENLLILPGESHRYVIAVMTRNLSWFYGINAHWTQKYLLSILDGSDLADKEAFWSGVLSGETILGEDIFFILKPYLIEMAHSDNAEKRRFLNSIVSLLSSAWSIIDEETSEKWVSDQELRDLLISADDKFRCQVLWNIRNFDEQIWFLHFKELISSVWPRQLVAKTPAVSHTFVEIALDAESHFIDVVVSILPFLTRLERAGDLYIHHDDFLKRHPKEAVLLFHTVLPDDAYLWPYAFGEWLETIKASYAEADDEQLIELSRKWDAR